MATKRPPTAATWLLEHFGCRRRPSSRAVDLYHYPAHPHIALGRSVDSGCHLAVVRGDSIVFQLWTQVALPLVAWIVCGWIVTRVDRGRTHRDLAPLFAGSFLF